MCLGDTSNFLWERGSVVDHGRRRHQRQDHREQQTIDMIRRDGGQDAVIFRHTMTVGLEKPFTEDIFPCFCPDLWFTGGTAGENMQQQRRCSRRLGLDRDFLQLSRTLIDMAGLGADYPDSGGKSLFGERQVSPLRDAFDRSAITVVKPVACCIWTRTLVEKA